MDENTWPQKKKQDIVKNATISKLLCVHMWEGVRMSVHFLQVTCSNLKTISRLQHERCQFGTTTVTSGKSFRIGTSFPIERPAPLCRYVLYRCVQVILLAVMIRVEAFPVVMGKRCWGDLVRRSLHFLSLDSFQDTHINKAVNNTCPASISCLPSGFG